MDDRGGRQIADAAQRIDREREVLAVDAKGVDERVDDFRPARVAHPPLDVAHRKVVVGEKIGDVGTNIAAHERWHLCAEHHAKPARLHVPAHDVARVGVETARARDHTRPERLVRLDCLVRLVRTVRLARGSTPAARTVAGHDHGASTVAKEATRDEIRGRNVVALHRERTELDREQQRDGVRSPRDKIVRAGDPRRATHASEPDHWQANDVAAKPNSLADSGLERGNRKPRHGRRDDEVDVIGPQPGTIEGATSRSSAEFNRGIDERVVRGTKICEAGVTLDLEGDVAMLDAAIAVDSPQLAPDLGVCPNERNQRFGESRLRVSMRGQRGLDGEDSGHAARLTHPVGPDSGCSWAPAHAHARIADWPRDGGGDTRGTVGMIALVVEWITGTVPWALLAAIAYLASTAVGTASTLGYSIDRRWHSGLFIVVAVLTVIGAVTSFPGHVWRGVALLIAIVPLALLPWLGRSAGKRPGRHIAVAMTALPCYVVAVVLWAVG